MDAQRKSFRLVMGPLDFLDGKHIVLASTSPRRRELLGKLGITFSVDTPGTVDESFDPSTPWHDIAPQLSLRKARAYARLRGVDADTVIIAADTLVFVDGKPLGKPHDASMARQMLQMLSGRTHTVVTGLSVITSSAEYSESETTTVEFAPLTDVEIDYYVERFRPFDKAGAYGIQEWIGAIGIRAINGDFYNVMGLPLHRLYRMLIQTR